MKILAGIVLYNPDLERLNENINTIEKQVSKVILVDNKSNNINQIKKSISKFGDKCILIENSKNLGVAAALNEVARYGIENLYDWFVTLDQDSVCLSNLVSTYKKYLNLNDIGQICCRNKDRNILKQKNKTYAGQYREVKECITSGSMINLKALKEVGGFDENLFIDWVDFEICYALNKNDYKTYEINFVGFIHEIGHPNIKKFFKNNIYIYNYSAFRDFYRSRNSLLVTRRYFENKKVLKRLFAQYFRIFKILLYEKDKMKKINSILMGIKCGLKDSTNRENYLKEKL